MRFAASFLVSIAFISASALAQDAGSSGPDPALDPILPTEETIDIGLAGDQPADIARYLLARGASDTALSPDGQTIAFGWDITSEREIWTIPVTGGQPRRLTYRTNHDFFRWLPDGSGILYGADGDGNELPAFFTISADGTQEREILPAAEGDYRIWGDFVGTDAFVYASPARNGDDFDIWRADFSGNREILLEGRLETLARAVSPDGRWLVYTRGVGEESDNLYLLDLTTGESRTISEPDPRASHRIGGFVWLDDSSGFFHSSNAGREWAGLTFYDVASGESTLAYEPEWDEADITLCGTDRQYITYTRNEDGFDTLHMWHLGEQRVVDRPALPEGTYSISCAGDTVVVRVSGWRTPGDIFAFSPGDTQARRVFASELAGIDPDSLVRPQLVRYAASDGVELQGLLYLPDGAGSGEDAPPAVILPHGGPSEQTRAWWEPVVQYHVARGIAVFLPNIRGSVGLGRTYATLDDRELRRDSVRDVVELLAALRDDGLIAQDRAVIWGGSYSGYLANAILSEYPDAFTAAVVQFGVGDWVNSLINTSPAIRASDLVEYGNIEDPEWRAFYEQISPIRRADEIRVPVLYSHGGQDPRIPFSETEIMVRALRENGVPVEYIFIPDEGHGYSKLANQLFYYRRQAEFIEEQLGLGYD